MCRYLIRTPCVLGEAESLRAEERDEANRLSATGDLNGDSFINLIVGVPGAVAMTSASGGGGG